MAVWVLAIIAAIALGKPLGLLLRGDTEIIATVNGEQSSAAQVWINYQLVGRPPYRAPLKAGDRVTVLLDERLPTLTPEMEEILTSNTAGNTLSFDFQVIKIEEPKAEDN